MSCDIRTWKVSYYHNDQRKWLYGHLTCCPLLIKFRTDSKAQRSQGAESKDSTGQAKDDHAPDMNSYEVELQYCNIKRVQKARSMLIYHAVTVETQDGTVHWFSSLSDRHSVFNSLEYFSRQNLLDNTSAQKPNPNSSTRTEIGQRLLQSAEDSERTLAAAAADLHGQGRQLDRAGVKLIELHEDLDVADRLLSGLNTYLGQWSLPPQYKQVDMVQVGRGDVCEDFDLEVLSSELSQDQWNAQRLCVLRVTRTGLTLMTSHQRLLYPFSWMELVRVFVVSPWEVVLTRRVAGRPAVSVSVVSAGLLPVLQLLERKVSHLMDYQTPPDTACDGDSHTVSRETRHPQHSIPNHKDQSLSQEQRTVTPHGSTNDQLQQGEQSEEQVSKEELAALCSKLGTLKSMAGAVGEELTNQNQALDDMIHSVDHADSRVKDATRRTKKLM